MRYWEAIERCVADVYRDVERDIITNAGQIDDRMQDCAQKLVDFQGHVHRVRAAAAPKHYPLSVPELEER